MRRLFLLVCIAMGLCSPLRAQSFTAAEIAQVDRIAAEALADSGVPSVSIAVVRNGQIAFARAYGRRSLTDDALASPDTRYLIGSISKQFTAGAVLILAQDGRLSLDDKLGRFLPETTAADRITLRQALSHTAGYRSYFTLDTTPLEGRSPVAPREIAERWGRAPLDFQPGEHWDYSSTGYTLAGLVVEQVAGEALADVLRQRVFAPLGMTSADDVDRRGLTTTDAQGYSRYALGPPRPARPIGVGWLFAAGGLAMTATDLARWDIAAINHQLIGPASWADQQTEVKLTDGSASGYGLGAYVDQIRGVRRLHHDGSIDGFGAENRIYPDARAAVVVLTNADFASIQFSLADQLEAMVIEPEAPGTRAEAAPRRPSPPAPDPVGVEELVIAKALYEQVRTGSLDRTRITPDVSDYFSATVSADYRASLSTLGDPASFIQVRRDLIGGYRASLYELTWPDRKLIAILRLDQEGKVASFVIFPA